MHIPQEKKGEGEKSLFSRTKFPPDAPSKGLGGCCQGFPPTLRSQFWALAAAAFGTCLPRRALSHDPAFSWDRANRLAWKSLAAIAISLSALCFVILRCFPYLAFLLLGRGRVGRMPTAGLRGFSSSTLVGSVGP